MYQPIRETGLETGETESGMECAILRILNSKGKDTFFEHNYCGCKSTGFAEACTATAMH